MLGDRDGLIDMLGLTDGDKLGDKDGEIEPAITFQ